METWRFISGFKSRYGRYRISNLGRVKNGNGKLASHHPHKKGYVMISLVRDDGSEGRFQLHRLVAKAFIPNPDNLPQVNHIDGNKKNNCVSNLQWVTNKQNAHHAIANGLFFTPRKGEDHINSKLTNIQADEIKKAIVGRNLSCGDLALQNNVSIHTIYAVRSGKTY